MSHKRWYAVFDKDLYRWETVGIPYDDGELKTEKTCLGAFKTKRAADFTCQNGFLIGSIKETEELAKQALIAPPKVVEEKPLDVFVPDPLLKRSAGAASPTAISALTLKTPLKLPDLSEFEACWTSSYTRSLIQHMMD